MTCEIFVRVGKETQKTFWLSISAPYLSPHGEQEIIVVKTEAIYQLGAWNRQLKELKPSFLHNYTI